VTEEEDEEETTDKFETDFDDTAEIIGTDELELEIELANINEKDSDETTIKTNNKRNEVQKKATERKESNDETTIKIISNNNNNKEEDQETISGYKEDIKSKPPKLKESKMMNTYRTQREERTSEIYHLKRILHAFRHSCTQMCM
jgi:hypothetical protein